MQSADPVNTFHRFERAGADLSRVRERISLNVDADRAPDVMQFVVRDIVDSPNVPGVQIASTDPLGEGLTHVIECTGPCGSKSTRGERKEAPRDRVREKNAHLMDRMNL